MNTCNLANLLNITYNILAKNFLFFFLSKLVLTACLQSNTPVALPLFALESFKIFYLFRSGTINVREFSALWKYINEWQAIFDG